MRLVFKPFEKNLFGQTRSWAADASTGRYVVEKAPNADAFSARLLGGDGRAIPLQAGAMLPTYDAAKRACEADHDRRVRSRIVAKAQRRP